MKKHVNLLPMRQRRAALIQKLLPRWCAVWTASLIVLACVFWHHKGHHESTLAAVSAKELAGRPVTATAKTNKRMRDEVRRFDCRETLVGQLRDDKPVLCFLATVSESARACEGRIVVRDLHFQQRAEGVVGDGNTSVAAEPEAVLTIQGDALDNLAIATFAAALRDAGLFRDVELKSSVDKPSTKQPVHSFIVSCEI